MTILRSPRVALLVIAPALVLATAGGCGGNGTDGREQNDETQPAATPTAEQPLSPYATLTRTEAQALAVKACTTGQFAATVTPQIPVDECVDRIYHQATDGCFHEADSSAGVPDEIVRQRCSFMEGYLKSWAGEGEQPEQYAGGDATDSMGAEPVDTPVPRPLDDVTAEEWEGLSDAAREDMIARVRSDLDGGCQEAPAAVAERLSKWYAAFGTDRSVGGVLADICTV